MVDKFEWDYLRPLVWGNGTFNPILNFTVKGIIYYQGCSNVGDPGNQYSERLKLLVEQWRSQFALGEIPFYFVQIAPYAYDGDNPDGISGALLRSLLPAKLSKYGEWSTSLYTCLTVIR